MTLNIQTSPYNPNLKIIPTSELRSRAGAIVDWTNETNTDLVIERLGKPKAAIMSFQEYERVQRLREEEERRKALEEWDQMSKKVQARNSDMTEAEVEAIAQETRDEVLTNIVEARKKKNG